MARQAFYSFHYDNDNWRASQVRNIGVIEGNRPASDNDWEAIKKGGDRAIQNWIDSQLRNRSVTVVLVGSATAGRKWISYEIEKSWNERMGVVGIHIHLLKDRFGNQSYKGNNPFNGIYCNGIGLSNIVPVHNSPYLDSKEVYGYISYNLNNWVEEALKLRAKY